MTVTLRDYDRVKSLLSENGIDSILYGSLGASVYLGNFREFNDVDLLVDRKYLSEEWSQLIEQMKQHGFQIVNKKEHEFLNEEGKKVAFAEKDVLIRDKICDPVKDVLEFTQRGVKVRTLTIDGFINAYKFSSKDGYRIEKRGRNDLQVVMLLQDLKRAGQEIHS